MNSHNKLGKTLKLILSAGLYLAAATDPAAGYAGPSATHAAPDHEYPAKIRTFQLARSGCRRYGVSWSCGVAQQLPDRISPRPVRTRWDMANISRIRCGKSQVFRSRSLTDLLGQP